MSVKLDLYDVQGIITKAYGHYGYQKARYIFYRIHDGAEGRNFVGQMLPHITTAVPWTTARVDSKGKPLPSVTTNVAFTYQGLERLGVPKQSLQSFPFEFSMGMRARGEILGDDAASGYKSWDPIWQGGNSVDIFLSINGVTVEDIEGRYKEICKITDALEGVEQLTGHKGANGKVFNYQEASILYDNKLPTAKEHFGYTDGISDPYFEGSGIDQAMVMGGGVRTREPANTRAGWRPLKAGEFVLGHEDEVGEYPPAPLPRLFSHNGSFLVYRKLHENVGSFNTYMDTLGADFPGGKEALAAKFAGRWKNGAPLASFPTQAEADQFEVELRAAYLSSISPEGDKAAAAKRYAELNLRLRAFDYSDDLSGAKCPIGAHVRRLNPRGALEYGQTGAYETPGALVDRRRIARRGLPYGKAENPTRDDGDHGIIFMVVNSDIKRQFEFCQQQWVNYGNDFKVANDKDPLLGNHGVRNGTGDGRMVIEADPSGDTPPFLCPNIPRFVETRGGDYFFIPSLASLHMIADGNIDPT